MGSFPDISKLSDQEVVALALERRKGAYAELVNRYGQRVHLLTYSIVGNEERAYDLTQDTFFKVSLFLQNYRPEKSFQAWILAIAHHAAIDYLRTRPDDSATGPLAVSASLIEATGRWAADAFDEHTTDPGTPELRAALEQALSELSPVQRQCIELHVHQQCTYQEMADILHLPLGTVKSHVHRALNKLRKLLGHLFDSTDPDHER